MSKKIDFTKEPELYIDGEKVKFHYSRAERLAKMPHRIKTDDRFFSKKFRHMHIIILDLIFIFVIGLIFATFVGKGASYKEDGFKYYLTKKLFTENSLDLNFQIKNMTKKDKILKYNNIEFKIINIDTDELIYSKVFDIKNNYFGTKEYYSNRILIEKPGIGQYKASVFIEENEKLNLNFDIK